MEQKTVLSGYSEQRKLTNMIDIRIVLILWQGMQTFANTLYQLALFGSYPRGIIWGYLSMSVVIAGTSMPPSLIYAIGSRLASGPYYLVTFVPGPSKVH